MKRNLSRTQLNLEFEAQNEINNDFERRKIVMTYLIHCWEKQPASLALDRINFAMV